MHSDLMNFLFCQYKYQREFFLICDIPTVSMNTISGMKKGSFLSDKNVLVFFVQIIAKNYFSLKRHLTTILGTKQSALAIE